MSRQSSIPNETPDDVASRLSAARGILLDWDGCVAIANRPSPAAVTFIARNATRIAIVSNNSTHLPSDIAASLREAGVEFPSQRIVLAGTEALALAASFKGARTMVLGAPRVKAYARSLGLDLVRENAETVVLLRDLKFSYAKLERAVRALTLGARLIVSNPDLTHPGPRGSVVPETGALLAAISSCIDLSRVSVDIIGKPGVTLFQRACALLGVSAGETVMIGDNPATDVLGAENMGMSSILVMPGEGFSLPDLLHSTGRGARERAEFLQAVL